ncbi:hypothetical protein HZS_5265 [Henneguya salminicola]|nr:hypothetical protein HZS_5265 [Henneguya salminicola]
MFYEKTSIPHPYIIIRKIIENYSQFSDLTQNSFIYFVCDNKDVWNDCFRRVRFLLNFIQLKKKNRSKPSKKKRRKAKRKNGSIEI